MPAVLMTWVQRSISLFTNCVYGALPGGGTTKSADVVALRPFYAELIAEFLPPTLAW